MSTAAPWLSTLLRVGQTHHALNVVLGRGSRSIRSVSTCCQPLMTLKIFHAEEFIPAQGSASLMVTGPCIGRSKRFRIHSTQGRDSELNYWMADMTMDSDMCECFPPSSDLGDLTEAQEREDLTADAWLVDEVTTPFSHISVIELGPQSNHEFAGAYILKLDNKDLVHSVYWHDQRVWTDSYYDEFTLLPPLVPPGPIGILGLGAGTVARLLLYLWPSMQLEGWEIDPEVVRVGRAYFGLGDLEVSNENENDSSRQSGRSRTTAGHGLIVRVGDALKEDLTTEGRFAGLIVDLYSNGLICEGLKDSSVWAMLGRRLQPGGRVMVNCGGPPVENASAGKVEEETKFTREEWFMGVEATIAAMSIAFDREINIKQLKDAGRNVMLLSGELPTLEDWSLKAPDRSMDRVWDWKQQRGRLQMP